MEHLSVSKLLEGLPRGGITEEAEQVFTHVLARVRGGKAFDAALEGLVLAHMRDAFFYARACVRGRMAADELYSLCYAALDRAARRHHYARGRYFAYAKPYIRGAIYRKWRSVDAVKGGGGTEQLPEQDHSPREEDAGPLELDDMITDPEFKKIDLKEKWETVKPLLSKLSDSERRVLELHYNGGMNFREIADLMGVTRSATQGTHTRALRKLRNALYRMRRLYE